MSPLIPRPRHRAAKPGADLSSSGRGRVQAILAAQRGATLAGYALIVAALVVTSLTAIDRLTDSSGDYLRDSGTQVGAARDPRNVVATSVITGVPSWVSTSSLPPSSTVPPSTVPPSTVPPSTVPPSTVPPSTVPPSTVPPSTVPPSTAAPSTAAPSTVPPAAQNIASAGTASSSSAWPGTNAGRINDGNTNGRWANKSVAHNAAKEAYPWNEIAFPGQITVSEISLYGRTDCCKSRGKDLWIVVSDSPVGGADFATLQDKAKAGTITMVQATTSAKTLANPTTVRVDATGSYVTVVRNTPEGYFQVAEIEIMGWAS